MSSREKGGSGDLEGNIRDVSFIVETGRRVREGSGGVGGGGLGGARLGGKPFLCWSRE